VRAGIVGTGWVAPVHANALRELGVEVAAVCSRSRSRAEEFGREYGAQPWDDLEAMLKSEELDVLHVCTPNDLHAPQTLLALEHGLHVVCEKPLATNTKESARMVEAAGERGVVGAVAHHVRGYPHVDHMRRAIAHGELGEVRVVHGRYLNDEALLPDYGWRFKPEQSGPSYVMGDLGTHWLDTAEHVTGLRVAEVLAEFRTFEREKEGATVSLDDTALVLLRFEGGAVGSVLVAGTAPGRKNQLVLECEGSRGGFTWDQEQPELLVDRPADSAPQHVFKQPGDPLTRFPPGHVEGYGDAFRNILRAAYRAMAGEEHGAFATFEDGHRGLQVLEAVVESARTGRWTRP
jgi:predicted dehydrogenase